MGWWKYPPYVPVAQRRANAAQEVAKLAKKGRKIAPVKIAGRTIAQTFWGKAWCTHLESYSDFENRLPRGRTYVRNGSVVDLQIAPGKVTALVSGSELYKIEIRIKTLAATHWQNIKGRCAGQVGSLIELLQGKLSGGVMAIMTQREAGLFPQPAEIKLECSCPDYAGMCKHVAATLYGVGARLDVQPELLFTLRRVDHLELIDQAGDVTALTAGGAAQKTIATADVADVFGIELEPSAGATAAPPGSEAAAPVVKPGRAGGRARTSAAVVVVPAAIELVAPSSPGKTTAGRKKQLAPAQTSGV